MANVKSTQKRSSKTVLLILLVAACIGFATWLVLLRDKDSSPPSNDSQTTQEEQATIDEEDSGVDQQYLIIKEYGIKLPLAVETLEAYYEFRNDTAYLSLEKYRGSYCAADQTTLGAITRFDDDDINELTGETYISMYPDVPKIGDYYYNFVSPQADCSADEEVRLETTNIRSVFRQSAAGIVAE